MVEAAAVQRRADAATMPSTMPDGAMMSAPAAAWTTAARASSSSVGSLSR